MPTVTAFGADYSAGELSPQEINAYNRANPRQPISFLIRYIGYPTNRKCISHYPGALAAHEESGTLVLLVHQIGYTDFHGGYAAGRQHAQVALADAEREGYPDHRPIFFAFDRWLGGNQYAGPLPLSKVWEYLDGAKSVLGHDRVGLYGFLDVIHPAIREDRVRWRWLCGAESGVLAGVDFYQYNNDRIYPGGMETDLNWSYVDLSIFKEHDMPLTDDDVRRIATAVLGEPVQMRHADGGHHTVSVRGVLEYDDLRAISIGAKIDAVAKVVAEIAQDDSNSVTLAPAQLATLTTSVEDRVAAEVDEMQAAVSAQIEQAATHLEARFDGITKQQFVEALREFYRPAVEASTT